MARSSSIRGERMRAETKTSATDKQKYLEGGYADE
jgi:hypothetical protein